MKKYFKQLITLIISFIIIPISVNAASASISVGGSSTAIVGNKVTVTVNLSSGSSIGSWQMNLNYDKSYLSLTGSTAEGGGTIMASSSATGVKSKSYTYTFKALKSGTTSVSVSSYLAYDYNDLSQMNISAGSKTINIKTQAEVESSYSKNNNLKALSVEGFTLSPEFNSSTTEYSVDVPEDTKQVTIKATKDDSTETINGDGTQEVTEGINTLKVVVQAQNGSEKTYTITVNVKDNNPINISIGDNTYSLVKISSYLPTVNGYNEQDISINEQTIPALYSETTKFTLVGLKDSEGNIKLYIYNESDNSYKLYQELNFNGLTIYPLETNDNIDGYHKTKITINDIEVEAYIYNDNSNFAIIYGENTLTGEKDYYLYDKKNNSITSYNDEYIKDLVKKNKNYSYYIIGLFSIIFILIIIIIVLLKKHKKTRQ